MADPPPVLVLSDRMVDLRSGEVHAEGVALSPLTGTELVCLRRLVGAQGATVAREVLIREIWPELAAEDTRVVDTAVRRIRSKIEPDARAPRHVLTVHGEGYSWAHGPEARDANDVITLDFTGLAARHGDRSVALTALEVRLLRALWTAGTAVSREHLLETVWLVEPTVVSSVVNRTVSRLRQKLEGELGARRVLETIRGGGVQLDSSAVRVLELASTSDRPTHNLPLHAKSFGSDDDVRRIDQRLDGGARLVTLVGAPGVGKTHRALVVAWARTRLAMPPRGGVWFLDLRGTSTRAVLSERLAALFQVRQAGEPEALLDHLRTRPPTLLVLDNFDHLVGLGHDSLSEWLAANAGLQIIVTSREATRLVGEEVLQVLPLPLGAATELLAHRARSEGIDLPQSSAETVALLEALDRLPLAIELGASRLAVFTVSELTRRLDERFRTLVGAGGAGPGGGAGKNRLWACMDVSWGLLDAGQQRTLTRTALFAGGFGLEALEEITDDPSCATHLAALTEKSLVVSRVVGDAVRFSLLEVVLAFARQRLDTDPTSADAEERFIKRFETRGWSLWNGLETKGVPAVREILADRENFLRAAELAARALLPGRGLAAALAIVAQREGGSERVVTAIEGLLRAARAPDDQVWIQYFFARATYATGDQQEGVRLFLACARTAEALGLEGLAVLAATSVPYVSTQEDVEQKRTRFNEILARARAASEPRAILQALWQLGQACAMAGDLAAAETHYADFRKVMHEHRFVPGVGAGTGIFRFTAGLLMMGHHDEAERLFLLQRSAGRSLEDPSIEALAHYGLAEVARARGEHEAALAANAAAQSLHARRALAIVLGIQRTKVLLDAGRLVEAEESLHTAEEHFDAGRYLRLASRLDAVRGALEVARGNLERGLLIHEKTLGETRWLGQRIEGLLLRAVLCSACGRTSEAATDLEDARRVMPPFQNHPALPAMFEVAEALATGRWDDARSIVRADRFVAACTTHAEARQLRALAERGPLRS